MSIRRVDASITPLSSAKATKSGGKHFGDLLAQAPGAGVPPVDLKAQFQDFNQQVLQGSQPPLGQSVAARGSDPYADKLLRNLEAAKQELVVATMDDLLKKMFA